MGLTRAQRHNRMMDRTFSNAHKLENERVAKGEMPNPSLTSPEKARMHGWHIKGREVTKAKQSALAKKIKPKSEGGTHKSYTSQVSMKKDGSGYTRHLKLTEN